MRAHQLSPLLSPSEKEALREPGLRLSGIWEDLSADRVLLAGYLLLAIPLAYFSRFRLTPDGVAYIEVARHWVSGSSELAINSYWSPLFSWLLAPAIILNLPPVFWARLTGVASGLLFSWASYKLYVKCFGARGSKAVLAACLLVATTWIPEPLSPDLLLSALLATYFLLAARLLEAPSLSKALACGVAGGIAYLSKAYALPFVGLHLFLSVLLFMAASSWGKRIKILLISSLGLLLVVMPWILTISRHDGFPTFGTASKYVRTWSPGTHLTEQFPHYRIQLPRAGRLSSWENPTEIPFEWPTWSPVQNWSGFRSQIWTLLIDLLKTCKYLFFIDLAGFVLLGFLLSLLQLFRHGVFSLHKKKWELWLLGSVALYFGGYELVLVWPRYLWPVIGLIFLFLFSGCFKLSYAFSFLKRSFPVARILAVGILLSLGLKSAVTLYESAFVSGAAAAWLRQVSVETLPRRGLVTANEWDRGIQFSYWNRSPFLGVFTSPAEALSPRLISSQNLLVLVFDDPDLANSLQKDQAFCQVADRFNSNNQQLSIFIPARRP